MTFQTEEEQIEAKIKADIDKAHQELGLELAKASGLVKPHMVYIAAGIGIIVGFLIGQLI